MTMSLSREMSTLRNKAAGRRSSEGCTSMGTIALPSRRPHFCADAGPSAHSMRKLVTPHVLHLLG